MFSIVPSVPMLIYIGQLNQYLSYKTLLRITSLTPIVLNMCLTCTLHALELLILAKVQLRLIDFHHFYTYRFDHFYILKYFLEERQCDVNMVNHCGWTLLHTSCWYVHVLTMNVHVPITVLLKQKTKQPRSQAFSFLFQLYNIIMFKSLQSLIIKYKISFIVLERKEKAWYPKFTANMTSSAHGCWNFCGQNGDVIVTICT